MLVYGDESRRNVSIGQIGLLTPMLSLEGLVDLLRALQPELETAGGLIPLWANELRRDLDERLPQ